MNWNANCKHTPTPHLLLECCFVALHLVAAAFSTPAAFVRTCPLVHPSLPCRRLPAGAAVATPAAAFSRQACLRFHHKSWSDSCVDPQHLHSSVPAQVTAHLCLLHMLKRLLVTCRAGAKQIWSCWHRNAVLQRRNRPRVMRTTDSNCTLHCMCYACVCVCLCCVVCAQSYANTQISGLQCLAVTQTTAACLHVHCCLLPTHTAIQALWLCLRAFRPLSRSSCMVGMVVRAAIAGGAPGARPVGCLLLLQMQAARVR